MPLVIPSVDLNDSKEYIFTNYIPSIETNKINYITVFTLGNKYRSRISPTPAIVLLY